MPDRLQLSCGRLLTVAPLADVTTALDATNGAKLDLAVRSARPIGLMRADARPAPAANAPVPGAPRARPGAPLNGASAVAAAASAAADAAAEYPVWRLSLLFECERNCRMAQAQIERHTLARRVEQQQLFADFLRSAISY